MGSVGLAALTTIFAGVDFFNHGQQPFTQALWTWMNVGNFNIDVNLTLDGLSLTMLSVVTGVGFFIHMFASWYMRGEGLLALLCLYQPVYRQHGGSGTGG